MTTMGYIEYDAERRQLMVCVEGNMWVKSGAESMDDIEGLNLKDRDQEKAFVAAAAPGGEGLEKYGFELQRGSMTIVG